MHTPIIILSILTKPTQKVLLICKTCSVKENLNDSNEDKIYSFEDLLFVLSEGWEDSSVLDIPDGDYNGVINAINAHY